LDEQSNSLPREGRDRNAGKGREGFNELFTFSGNDLAERKLCHCEYPSASAGKNSNDMVANGVILGPSDLRFLLKSGGKVRFPS
jgi:hypothetical protein